MQPILERKHADREMSSSYSSSVTEPHGATRLVCRQGERSGLSEERKLGRRGQERFSRGQEWSPHSQGDELQRAVPNAEELLLVWLCADTVSLYGDEQRGILRTV